MTSDMWGIAKVPGINGHGFCCPDILNINMLRLYNHHINLVIWQKKGLQDMEIWKKDIFGEQRDTGVKWLGSCKTRGKC